MFGILSIFLLRSVTYEMRLKHFIEIFYIPDCWWHLTLCKNLCLQEGTAAGLLIRHWECSMLCYWSGY